MSYGQGRGKCTKVVWSGPSRNSRHGRMYKNGDMEDTRQGTRNKEITTARAASDMWRAAGLSNVKRQGESNGEERGLHDCFVNT